MEAPPVTFTGRQWRMEARVGVGRGPFLHFIVRHSVVYEEQPAALKHLSPTPAERPKKLKKCVGS